jgi:A/G-specific adenine glycosylase
MRNLVAWFHRQRRILPWREDPSLYRVWISEIMLQQTQVVTVLPYFERFMRTFPTVEDLARAPDEVVMKAWEGLGYYSRARNLHRAAKTIVSRAEAGGGDGFPRTREGWLEIPGVGPYTAGAITSIALGLPEPIVDGNVERVFARLRRLARSVSESGYKEALWGLSAGAVTRAYADRLSPSDLNQAWMELGATICTPKKPACLLCPIAGECEARRAGAQEEYPEKKKRPEWIAVDEKRVALVDLRAEKVLLVQAAAGAWRAGLWDFPETRVRAGKPLGTIESKHVVTRHKIVRSLEVIAVKASAVKDGAGESRERWVSLPAPEVPVGSACAKGIGLILERFF